MEFLLGIVILALVIAFAPLGLGILVGVPLCFVNPILGIIAGVSVGYFTYYILERD